jgi:tetratricopeptide (TPR) repeat protein
MLRRNLDLALQQHQAGRMAEAEAGYRAVLAVWPTHADALHLLGLVFHQTKRHEQALLPILRALELQPRAAEYYNSLTAIYIALKQLDAAIAAGRRAVELQPNLPEAWCNLGNALCASEQNDPVNSHPVNSNPVQNSAAIESYLRALALRPTYALALMGLGNALMNSRRYQEAITAYRKAIAARADLVDAYYNLGNAYRGIEDNRQAVACYRQAIALKPDHLEAINNLACTLQQMGDLDQALHILQDAAKAHPTKARVRSNIANLLAEADQWDRAIAGYQQAIAIQADYYEARFNLSLALLMTGDFERGWQEYEYRWKCDSFPSPRRYTHKPLWLGEPLDGRRILIHAEQGFGDTLQFVRYVPLVAERGGKVIFQVQTQLHRLLRRTPGAEVIAQDPRDDQFDLQCPLLSAPLAFQTRLDSVPPIPPRSVTIDPAEQAGWKARLNEIQQPGHRLNIGLIWSGSPRFPNNARRGIKLDRLAPLASMAGINFISLQKGPAAEEARHPPQGMRLIDWTDELNDFADTAALISQLDLVISTDTGPAHLAALIGVPTWMLLMFSPDFRWLRQRADSPWYPRVRLFRQPTAGDWETPVEHIARMLKQLTVAELQH